ncbi:hypothetical protein DSM104299_00747 [Baekduia alba]|uniref:hypothetical protein n=1 Tax=Baekduia alba TaxID=2997333 RepID=UPI002341C6E4|nr:hypothetical protein [Baekduia alba]WCB92065.1 hypothetical protein DSM104299_00747 [Baekduia alba]
MADDDRSPDHTDDPRKQEEGSGGYPETTPGGTEGGGERKREGDTDAPSSSTDKEADRESSTGNPDAAG